MDFGIASVAGITMICYLAGMGMKASEKVKNEVIPVVCGCAGAALGVAGMFVMPDFPAQDVINARRSALHPVWRPQELTRQ